MSETFQQPYPVSRVAGNRVWHDWHDWRSWHNWQAVSSPQPRLGAAQASAPTAPFAQRAHILDTLEALHNLTRSGTSSPLSRMSPAALLPESGKPVR